MIFTKANIKNFLRDSRKYLFCKGYEEDISKYQYFLFINSKVTNIIDQVYPPFQKGFFDKDKILILYKHHFESVKYIRRDLKKYGLHGHCIINYRDIPSVEGAVWFYTHNSMQNFAVINKNLYSHHVWIGHGDSEKIAYYKKMIRIFDTILVTGDKAIERFIEHKIFSERQRDKFLNIGKWALCSVMPTENPLASKSAILFAPTWEGAMVEENYSTLHLVDEGKLFMKKLLEQYPVDKIVIKLHPNTGIRDSKLINETKESIEALLSIKKEILFIAEKGDWVYSWIKEHFKNRLEYQDKLYDLNEYHFKAGVTNISAMASMVDAEDIPTFVIYDSSIKVQERVLLSSGIKIDITSIDKLSSLPTPLKRKRGVISYEEDWEKLDAHEVFKRVLKRINQE